MIKAIFVALFMTAIFSLHTQTFNLHLSSFNNHLVDGAVNQLYFSNEINAILTQINYVSRTLAANDSNKFSFLISKCSELETSVPSLQASLTKYHLPINQVNHLCPKVSTFNRSEIRLQIVNIEKSVNDMEDYQMTCLNCVFIQNDINQIQNLTKTYIQLINQTLDGKFCSPMYTLTEKAVGMVNLNASLFKNNLQAKNWYYGSTTVSDYKIYLFKRAATFNLTSCPLSAPYVKDNEQVCFDCPEGSIFNLGSQKCDTCKSNEILNVESGKCDKCYGQKRFINQTLTCMPCNITAEIILNMTTGKCESCGKDSYMDRQTLSCIVINCSQTTPRFNRTTKQCEACPVSMIIDPNDVAKCIQTNYVAICPTQTPFYDPKTYSCVACPAKTTYNSANNQCLPSESNLNHHLVLCSDNKQCLEANRVGEQSDFSANINI